jgi:Pup amidohydrolase
VLARLAGLETEYAVRFTPAEGARRPGNQVVYQALAAAVGDLVATRPGMRRGAEEGRIFTQTGASLCYESFPEAPDGGLVEAGTPECRGPSQLLCHQKGMDALLVRALPGCSARLAALGHHGELGLIKNCRDAEGHVYGAQESYEAEVAHGLGLFLYRAALVLALPVVIAQAVLTWALVLVTIPVVVALVIVAPLVALAISGKRGIRALLGLFDDGDVRVVRALARGLRPLERVVFRPLALGAALPFRLAFRRQRRAMLAFLVSRPIVSGAGTLDQGEIFSLSEKGPAIRRLVRFVASPEDRPLFETGNLLKDLLAPASLRLAPVARLFRARQRLQLGLADSNVAEVAEYLKIGTTALVLDMAEAGFLDDAPRLLDPIAALRSIAADPTLRARVAIAAGAPVTALDLQRWYLERARRYVREAPVVALEARSIVKSWGETLDALAADPGRLVGALDWVTKRWLLEACGADASPAARKKIDLRYHELGEGYLARLARAGLARTIVSAAEVTAAMRDPPADSPAARRGELIRDLAGSRLPVRVSWDSVRVGGRLRGKVIPLR